MKSLKDMKIMEDIQEEDYENSAKSIVPVVLAADQEYVPILFVCLKSLADCANADRKYHIYIFHTDIAEGDMQIFQKEFACEHIRIDFMNVSAKVAGYALRAKEHITAETFYRFLILDILKDYPKAVYLDADIIVCRDIAELYDRELGNALLAAAVDPDFVGQYYGANLDTRYYCKEVLRLKKPYRYAQAGVLVFNIKAMHQEIGVRELFHMAEKGKYRYSDQDILNIVCEGRIKKIAMSWNMLTDSVNCRSDVIQSAPASILEEYMQARKHPYIIHYAGASKPWKNPETDFAREFWKYARQTPYYEELIYRMLREEIQKHTHLYTKKVFGMIRRAAKKTLPQNSRFRRAVSSLYWRTKCIQSRGGKI